MGTINWQFTKKSLVFGNSLRDANTSSWKSAPVVNAHLVDDPTIQQPGLTLPRQHWSLLNRFCTGQGHCGVCRKTWGLTEDTDLCSCGETQTMSHIVESCPLSHLSRSWTVVCPSFTLLMMLLLPGWPTMGLNRIRKKKIALLKLTTAQYNRAAASTNVTFVYSTQVKRTRPAMPRPRP